MKETIRWIDSEDLSFYTVIWEPTDIKPKAIFYLVHGSVEHSMRYKRFAKSLTDQGYIVIAPDLRGHGKTAEKNNTLGHFTDDPMGWELCVHDLKVIYDHFTVWYPNFPVVLFGHSMGSYLVRMLMKEYPVPLQGVIISGSGGFARGIGDAGIWMAKAVMRVKGVNHKSPFLTDLVYGTLNKKIAKTTTPFDFLSSDTEEVQHYINDPLCGYVCSAEFIHEMLLGTRKSNQAVMFELENKALPMLIISGGDDPVGDKNNKGIKKVVKNYTNHLDHVTFKLYEGARHELLNELNRVKVTEDIVKWLLTL